MDELAHLKNIYFEEAAELLANIESSLLVLEKNPADKKIINQIFRDVHTIKGSGSLFDFANINNVAHELEDLLEAIKHKNAEIGGEVAGILFKSVDLLRHLLDAEKKGHPDEHLNVLSLELTSQIKQTIAGISKKKPSKKSKKDAALPEPAPHRDAGVARNDNAIKQTSVRVNAEKLDSLVDLVGELVISHSIIMQHQAIQNINDRELNSDLSQLGKVINDMQDRIMALRMIPISHSFNRMKRLVRDMSIKLEKDVELRISGEDTEIDKNVVDDLNEILVHLIRNSIDHGIEVAEERKKSGKRAGALIELNAYPKGGNIVIDVKDDGRGLSRERLIAKAKEKGMDSRVNVDCDFEVFQLIFEPGFSTACKVTDISGRGVGLDAVKRKLEDIRGKIEVASDEGKGTTFTITLQPSLAIIDGMVFSVGSERMILPTLSIEESLRPSREQVITIEGSTEAVMVRGKVYPLIRLHKLFSINSGSKTKPWEALVMLAGSQGRKCVILIDELIGQQQVVIKGLGSRFQRLKAISGGAILGDGRVGLILDLDGLIDYAHERTA